MHTRCIRVYTVPKTMHTFICTFWTTRRTVFERVWCVPSGRSGGGGRHLGDWELSPCRLPEVERAHCDNFPSPAAVLKVPSVGFRFATSSASAVIETGAHAVSAIILKERKGGVVVVTNAVAGQTCSLAMSSSYSGDFFKLLMRSMLMFSQSRTMSPFSPQRRQVSGPRGGCGGTAGAVGAAGTAAQAVPVTRLEQLVPNFGA